MNEADGPRHYYQELRAACRRYAQEFEQEYDDLDEFIASTMWPRCGGNACTYTTPHDTSW